MSRIVMITITAGRSSPRPHSNCRSARRRVRSAPIQAPRPCAAYDQPRLLVSEGRPPAAPSAEGRGFAAVGPIVLVPTTSRSRRPPPPGFNVTGKAFPRRSETVEYDSKTVGTRRKALVYTPPNYTDQHEVPRALFAPRHRRRETDGIAARIPPAILDNLIADRKGIHDRRYANGRAQPNDRAEGNVMATAPAFANFEREHSD